MSRKGFQVSRLIAAISIVLVLALNCWSQQSPRRDLTKYEDGGTYDLNWDLAPIKHAEVKATIRSFIWTRWKEQRRSRLMVSGYTLEGSPRTIDVYIEPGVSGNWQINLVYNATDYPMPPFKGRPKKRRWAESYDQIRRLKLESSLDTELDENDSTPPEQFTLKMKNSRTRTESIW
jgi:hypothetical protein